MKTANQFVALTVLLLSAAAGTAQTVPALINYQGRLANPDGTALATGDYTLTFRVYDSATNSAGLVWGPQVFDGVAGQGHGWNIPVVQGYFNVMLGPEDTATNSLANAFNATNRYVEIQVGTNNPISPRQRILSAPFALQAGNSAKLSGADWSAVFGTNDPVNGKILSSKLATNSISITNLISRQAGTNVGVGGLAISPSVTFSTNATSFTDVPNMSVTIQTSGRPVMLLLSPPQTYSGSASYVELEAVTSGGAAGGRFGFWRNGNQVSEVNILTDNNNTSTPVMVIAPGQFSYVDFPGAGNHTYQFKLRRTAGNAVYIFQTCIIAYEL
jgi:hypothetical protein